MLSQEDEEELRRRRSTTSRVDKARHRSAQRKAEKANFWPSGPPEPYISVAPLQESPEQIWQIITAKKAHHPDFKDFVRVYCTFDRPPTLEHVMTWRRTWSSWSYEGAYPCFSRFLKGANIDIFLRCSIFVEDLDVSAKRKQKYLFQDSKNYGELWDILKRRPIWDKPDILDPVPATVRLVQIVDLSPMVLTCILGSTPKLDVSYLANFIDRHLKFSNYGKVNLLTLRDMSWSSYTLEYHFSVYYVSSEYTDPEEVRRDPRAWRKSAPFGREKLGTIRHIHEETLSFLLINHLDICTCFQLEEAYWRDPYAKDFGVRSFRPYDPDQAHAMLFLSWIAVALHHVSWRWESAIAAIDSEIMSPEQVVFTSDRDVLMTDDPQFSHAKTYYWALQSYKLFEQKLVETINLWRDFQKDSMKKLWHSKLERKEWQMKEQSIDLGIMHLQDKVERIRKRINEVKELREGLASASALFDSRTAVRQGDNIRLLTYVNLLFLPLSFGTSIFGMQIMGNSNRVVHAFAIALPCITILTLLVIINLENLLQMFESAKSNAADRLRHHMRHHRRRDWKGRAIEIDKDKATKAPVPKARRTTGGWIYVFFILEAAFAGIPAHELLAARRICLAFLEKIHLRKTSLERSLEKGLMTDGTAYTPHNLKRLLVRERAKKLREQDQRKAKENRQSLVNRLGGFVNVCLKDAVLVLRAILLPLWLVVLAVEYLLLVAYLKVTTPSQYDPISANAGDSNKTSTPNQSCWLRAIHTLGLDDILDYQPPTTPAPTTAEDSNDIPQRGLLRKATTFARSGALGSQGGIENIMKEKKTGGTTTTKMRRAGRFGKGGLNPDLALVDETQEGSIRTSSPAPSRRRSTAEMHPQPRRSTDETQASSTVGASAPRIKDSS